MFSDVIGIAMVVVAVFVLLAQLFCWGKVKAFLAGAEEARHFSLARNIAYFIGVFIWVCLLLLLGGSVYFSFH